LYYKDSEAIAEIYGGDWAERFIGVGDWVRGEIPMAINGDHMIGFDPDRAMNSFNPFLHLYIAVSRMNNQGRVYGSHQKLSRLQALRAMTSAAAYLSFDEQQLGSLETGKLADLAVLDRDYLSCPEAQIREIRVLMTMVDGKVVHAIRPFD
jgi:predicted amidohydrolase YtcJ